MKTLLTSIMFILLMLQLQNGFYDRQIITAITDNGCASHQELSQTKSNADVYNYPALSTSY